MNFRHEAIKAVCKAKHELASKEEFRLKYVALELRMALECLIYDTSKVYRDELSEEDFDKWQPRKLLEAMIEIDPSVEKSSEWKMGIQDSKGSLPSSMTTLGTDRRLSLKEIKKYYDRFGSYLHTPTIKQLEEKRDLNLSNLSKSCKDLIEILDEILSSPIYNTRMKKTSKISCKKCNRPIARSITDDQNELNAKCRNCGASYSIISDANGKVTWQPHVTDFKCGGKECPTVAKLFDVEIEEGNYWDCHVCNGRNVICLGTIYQEPEKSSQALIP